MKVTIHDVARRAGVSVSTVSRVINKTTNVKGSKFKAVMEAIEYYNYEPNQFGRGLVKQISNTIGVYFPNFSSYVFDNLYIIELLKGMARVIEEYNFSLLMINENYSKNTMNLKPQFEEHLKQKKIDGLLLTYIPENSLTKSSVAKLLKQNYPIAYVGKRIPGNGFNVYAQYEKYTLKMFEELYRNGHKKIIVFLLTEQTGIFEKTKQKLNDLFPNLELSIKIISFEMQYNIRNFIFNAIKEFVQEKKFTAICSMQIENASIILRVCNELNLSVPEDVSLISVEHKEGAGQQLFPQVNAFYVPAFKMGMEASKMLFSQLNGNKPPNYSIEFETSYFYRNSIKKIN